MLFVASFSTLLVSGNAFNFVSTFSQFQAYLEALGTFESEDNDEEMPPIYGALLTRCMDQLVSNSHTTRRNIVSLKSTHSFKTQSNHFIYSPLCCF